MNNLTETLTGLMLILLSGVFVWLFGLVWDLVYFFFNRNRRPRRTLSDFRKTMVIPPPRVIPPLPKGCIRSAYHYHDQAISMDMA
jgi:hypothetical protein